MHFQETVIDNVIVFDYRIHEDRDAIRLLRLMGYGTAIVDEAEKMAERFVARGSWKSPSPSGFDFDVTALPCYILFP